MVDRRPVVLDVVGLVADLVVAARPVEAARVEDDPLGSAQRAQVEVVAGDGPQGEGMGPVRPVRVVGDDRVVDTLLIGHRLSPRPYVGPPPAHLPTFSGLPPAAPAAPAAPAPPPPPSPPESGPL